MIPFNKPYISGEEITNIQDVLVRGKLSGNGIYSKKCENFLETKYGFQKSLLTTSCTDALEMCAILTDIKPGDEIIVPSYTFVSTALAFIREKANIVFADSCSDNPNIDPDKLEALITSKTKAIVPVHYAGVACDMEKILSIADKYQLLVIEDAAQAIDSYYKNKPLGTLGTLSAFSFHETKNVIAGEGGLLVVNDSNFNRRAEVIWEKGTNRAEFFRGEINKYGWVDTGSSFLPSELNAAFLWGQLNVMDAIQQKRLSLWKRYEMNLKPLTQREYFQLGNIPNYATNNAHMFYIVCRNLEERTSLVEWLKKNDVFATFHYLSLHKSEFYHLKHDGRVLPNADRFTDCLLRLPFYTDLSLEEVDYVCTLIDDFYK